MVKLREITLISFQEAMRRRVFYIILLLFVVVIVLVTSQIGLMHMAAKSGESATLTHIRQRCVTSVIGFWEFASFFLAIFLGAVALFSEVKAKTIVHVLSRPVARWVYLLGRWLGVLLFLWVFLAVGILLALALGLIFGTQSTPLFWFGLGQLFVYVTLFSGVSLALSVIMPPAAAGALAFLLSILPSMMRHGMEHPNFLLRWLATVGYYAGPADMPGNLINESFAKEIAHPKYFLYGQVSLENFLYAVVAFTLACAIFKRRELPLR